MPVVGYVVQRDDSAGPPPHPRHDMLWMSVGILIGYFVIAIIMKGLDKLRGNRMAKLGDMVNEIDRQRNSVATKDRRIAALEADVRGRDALIQSRDTVIASERRQRADAELEVARLRPSEREADNLRPRVARLSDDTRDQQIEVNRLQPFEIEANDLRPQIGMLRDEIRDRNREIASLKADITKIQSDLEIAYQRFEVVNQRAAEGKDVEKNLKNFIREREVALERIKAQHEEQLETLREKHEDEKELMQQQREEKIEAVRRNANSELDSIIITKNRELVQISIFEDESGRRLADSKKYRLEMLRRERATNTDNRSPVSAGPSELGSMSSRGNLRLRGPAPELHSVASPQELESGMSVSELSSSSRTSPKPGTGK